MQFINLPLFDRLPAEKPAHSLAEQTMPLSGADLGTKVQAALQAIKRKRMGITPCWQVSSYAAAAR